MSKRLHTILNEKYRPDTLEGYICKEDIKTKFEEFISKQDIPHLLFAGKPGAGKTTIAKILVKNIDCDYLYINATDERSIEIMRDKVGAFAAAGSFKPLKVVILDEATHLLQASQVILLNMMETYSLTTRFILTGNYPERLIDPLRSRCQEFDLQPPSKKVVAQYIDNILNKENIEHTIEDIVTIVNKFYPDFRKVINNCQKYTVDGVITLDKSVGSDNNYQSKILDELKKPSIKSFNAIRQLIANAETDDFESMYVFLYDKLNEYANGNEGIIICYLEEYMYHAAFRVDKEINICALIARILETISAKKII
jgi:DNA polymerase III delta prime subunit